MSANSETYAYFLEEANDLLHSIEQDLLSLRTNRTIATVHNLMRSAHTLKGAAASVGLETIKTLSHVLEDIFKMFYNPNVVIDAEVEALLFQGYECLRLTLSAEFTGGAINESAMLDRAASVIAQLQDKLGDCFDQEAMLPTSADLGFDIVQSMFESGVSQRLETLEQALQENNPQTLQTVVQTTAEILLGLAESLELPGFEAIAQTTLTALKQHPEQVMQIARLALQDFRQGQSAVLQGDRTEGGASSTALRQLATVESPQTMAEGEIEELESADLLQQIEQELDQLLSGEFLANAAATVTSQPSKFTGHEVEPGLMPLMGTTKSAATALETITAPEMTPERESALAETSSLSAVGTVQTKTLYPTPIDGAKSAHSSPTSSTIRVEIEQLERLNYITAELLIHQNRQVNQDESLRFTVRKLLSNLQKHQQIMGDLQDLSDRMLVRKGTWGTQAIAPTVIPAYSPTPEFDALELDQYNDLHFLIQQALNQFTQLKETSEEIDQFTRHTRYGRSAQHRLLAEMRDGLTSARMQALGEVFNRFPRVLQQLSAAYDKSVELVLMGKDVLVDKAIAERLYDPLLHLVRNAFDHGIESVDVRRARHKPDVGRIEICAYHDGNQTLIEVRDDGGGIDLEQIAQRAMELNLLSPEQIKQSSPADLLNLVFEPGFSTASQINDLSGRGVGLDVVRAQVQTLDGQVSVASIAQKGTTITLHLPVSLTIAKLLVCNADDNVYALPVESIQQVIAVRLEQLQQTADQQFALRWRFQNKDQLIPIQWLSKLITYKANPIKQQSGYQLPQLSSSESTLTDLSKALAGENSFAVLLLNTAHGLSGLAVDQVLGEQELVIRPLGAAIASPPYVYGCCILGNSGLALVIDARKLVQSQSAALEWHQTSPIKISSLNQLPLLDGAKAGTKSGARVIKQERVLLVVDDSLTLRQALSSTLIKGGFQVLQAQDGLEAIAYLQEHSDIALVICDIEMPRMNGFQFLNQFRQNLRYVQIPVVMLTSRTADKHRQLALQLGASAYLTKPYKESELLSTVTNLIHIK
ncbi:hybrid sensor histidine kinase/response regulator [Oscillatoria sp. FACHB-1407]|uniref:hybrid sensor histidine kinase/response regulator n=1 Tax=Oscillatoria sp. FACHB-1407 TaxID=2692847 RepID=UPI001688F2A0|nr:hybrid sensor histidine kinase/response regulator [Oscillatoria sp. FACHB-1407]MBD2461384.1 hybrid sensor histidine kinase/response regulator [Oscillatoria sp. FACHB-1407]